MPVFMPSTQHWSANSLLLFQLFTHSFLSLFPSPTPILHTYPLPSAFNLHSFVRVLENVLYYLEYFKCAQMNHLELLRFHPFFSISTVFSKFH